MIDKAVVLIVAVCAFASFAFSASDEEAVRSLLHTTFDKTESRLVVDPVVAKEGYAIAGWSQGDMGGRALLHKKHGSWTLILCAGDGIKSAEGLGSAGLPPEAAGSLAEALARAEKNISADRLALFAKFEGLVRMDEAGSHPPDSNQKH